MTQRRVKKQRRQEAKKQIEKTLRQHAADSVADLAEFQYMEATLDYDDFDGGWPYDWPPDEILPAEQECDSTDQGFWDDVETDLSELIDAFSASRRQQKTPSSNRRNNVNFVFFSHV